MSYKNNRYIAKHQIHSKPINMVSGIKINGYGANLGRVRKESEYLMIRVNTILTSIRQALVKKKITHDIPKMKLEEKGINKLDLFLDKDTGIIHITQQFIKTRSDDLILISLLYEIGKYFFLKHKFNEKDLRYINTFIRRNRKQIKSFMSGIYLCIPKEKYGKGICLPKINTVNIQEFTARLFSLYVQGLFPKTTNNQTLDKIIQSIHMVFSK